MSEEARYLYWIYRRNLFVERGVEERKGLIAKLNRRIRNYERR